MHALYIIAFISAFALWTNSITSSNTVAEPGDATLNFLIYRDAVVEYAENNSLVDGVIPSSSLTFPTTWLPTSTWSNQVVGNDVYIWGQLSQKGKDKLEELTYCSQAYFYNDGFGTEAICTGIAGPTIPIALPNKTVVSAIEVN